MTITHIVMFTISPSAPPGKIEQITTAFHSLQQTCLHPTTKDPYILSLTGGANTSTELFRAPYSHGFVTTFKDKGDLEYYLKEDPAHKAFEKIAMERRGVVEGERWVTAVGVVDFEC